VSRARREIFASLGLLVVGGGASALAGCQASPPGAWGSNGTGTDLVEQALSSDVTTLASLRAFAAPTSGNPTRLVLGYRSVGDFGGGIFVWKVFASSPPADNDGTVLKPTGYTGNGRWLRLYSGAINVKWFGARGDGTNADQLAIQQAIDAASQIGGGEVCFPPVGVGFATTTDVYLLTAPLALRSGVTLVGAGKRGRAILKYTGSAGAALSAVNTDHAGLRSLRVYATQANGLEIKCTASQMNLWTACQDVDFAVDGAGAACVYLEANDGTGGLGHVYWPSFRDCEFHGAAPQTGNAGIRTRSAGNGGVFHLRMEGGRTYALGRHFDLVSCHGARVFGTELDGATVSDGSGRYLYLGPSTVENAFFGLHCESGAVDRMVELAAGSADNTIEDSSGNDINNMVSDAGQSNKTLGFFHHTSSDSNIDPAARTFVRLLQDVIYEKTPDAGTTIGCFNAKVGSASFSQLLTLGGGLKVAAGGFLRPDGAGVALELDNGTNYHFANEHHLRDAPGGTLLAQVDGALADGETALLLRRNVGGAFALERVTVGPPDSAGPGFRVLRITN
jgi:hypothetical protein